MSATVLRVFGVGRADDPAQVQVIRDSGLAALVEAVSAEDWSAEALPRRLEDLSWLEAQARRHDAMLRGHLPFPVVPFPLTTVFTDEEGVRRVLHERADSLGAALERVAGRLELGVVVHVDPAAVLAAEVESVPAGDRPGAAYIERRLRQQRRAELTRADAVAVADAVHARLAPLSEDSVRSNPRPVALDDDPGVNVLNASYLVHLEAVSDFDAEIGRLSEELASSGTRIRRTGPWAPFHFVDREPAS
jgi:hypothetical protein